MKTIKILLFFTSLLYLNSHTPSAQNIDEKVRKVINDRLDKHNLREKNEFIIDQSEKMLIPHTDEMTVKDFTVAKVPPEIKMMIIPGMEPAYFYDYTGGRAYWSNWAVPARSDDNRFFFAVGDDRKYGAKLNIYEYIPGRETVSKVVDVAEVLGFSNKNWADGKIHGRIGLMPDGTMWITTHSSEYRYDEFLKQMDKGYRGSWLLSYNIYTHETKNWGVPLIGHSLPETTLDVQRGRYFCVGEYKGLLCWDVVNHKATYAGYPPNGWIWFKRASLLDETMGKYWSTIKNDTEHHFISFDPELNRFVRYDITPPENLYTHDKQDLRAYTESRAMDGAFYCITHNGVMFRFKPEIPEIESIGVNWDKGRYTSTMALDPSGRYIYYMPGDIRMYNANKYGPIVQYDVKTGTKKVLAWLVDYYYEKYGYWVGGTYGMEISNDGSFLVIVMNGAFKFREGDFPYGNPSLFVVHIPEPERPEE